MAYNVSNIIKVNAFLSSAGMVYANFASAMLLAPFAEIKDGLVAGTIRDYESTSELAKDFAETTETYKAAAKWLGGTPSSKTISIYLRKETEIDAASSLNAARDKRWWFFTFFTKDVYENKEQVKAIADWCEQNSSFFFNCQTGDNAIEIRTPDLGNDEDGNPITDIASDLTARGFRFTATATHATDPYIGIAAAKHPAAVNFAQTNSTITLEYKKLAGVEAESLGTSEQNAMKAKRSMFYTVVESSGVKDIGRIINTRTHSTYGEYIDDVINLEAFKNQLTIDLYNKLAGAETKLGQDSVGMSSLLSTVALTCERFIANGYLGSRTYIDPDDGKQKSTIGYEILTQPQDIELITDAERAERLSAPIRIRAFRKGAIHQAIVDLYVN